MNDKSLSMKTGSQEMDSDEIAFFIDGCARCGNRKFSIILMQEILTGDGLRMFLVGHLF